MIYPTTRPVARLRPDSADVPENAALHGRC